MVKIVYIVCSCIVNNYGNDMAVINSNKLGL